MQGGGPPSRTSCILRAPRWAGLCVELPAWRGQDAEAPRSSSERSLETPCFRCQPQAEGFRVLSLSYHEPGRRLLPPCHR